MNKIIKTIIASLGAINVVFDLATPIIIGGLYIVMADLTGWSADLVYSLALLSTLYRGIKFWIK